VELGLLLANHSDVVEVDEVLILQPTLRGEWMVFGDAMIRKLASGQYRLYSKKTNPKTGSRRNLGTFRTRKAAEDHERAVQYFKRQ
jgi:hypothetical protein